MKKYLLAVFVLIGFIADAQTPSGFTRFARKDEVIGLGTDSNMFVPRYATVPTNRNALYGSGQLGIDTVGNNFYFYSDSWIRLAKYSEITGGSPNSNVGSGYRLGFPNTNDIKTLLARYGITLDSTTANSLGIKVDTATLFPAVRSTISSGTLQQAITAGNSIAGQDNEVYFGNSYFALVNSGSWDRLYTYWQGDAIGPYIETGVGDPSSNDYTVLQHEKNKYLLYSRSAAFGALSDLSNFYFDMQNTGNTGYIKLGMAKLNSSQNYAYTTEDFATIKTERLSAGIHTGGIIGTDSSEAFMGFYNSVSSRAEGLIGPGLHVRSGGDVYFDQAAHVQFDTYGPAWNGNDEAPSKDDIYDKIEALVGSSTTPEGNFGNIQINRNSVFSTPASDSLDWESATGLQDKGNRYANALTSGTVAIYDTVTGRYRHLPQGTTGYVLTQHEDGYVSWAAAAGGGTVMPSVTNFRLTTETGVAVSTSNRTAQSTIYFTPFHGNHISLYSGAAWVDISSAEVSLALSGLTSGKNYDVFAYNNAGTLTLELSAAWTNDGTRADALTLQDGILVKSGTTTRRYVGTIRTTSTTTTEDSKSKRFVWNLDNQVDRSLEYLPTDDSWTYATQTWRQGNNSASYQVEYVTGDASENIQADLSVNTFVNHSAQYSRIGIGVSSTSAPSGQFPRIFAATNVNTRTASYKGTPGLGYYYIAWLEYGADGTSTFYGDDGGNCQSALYVMIKN